MKRLIIILLFFSNFSIAQNLVVNYSFEDTVTCQQWSSLGGWPLFPCVPWYSAFASSDYLSLAYTKWCGSSPIPGVAGFQYPFNGYAYCGFDAYQNLQSNNYREYIGGHLNSPLQAGHKYCVSFYVSPGDTCQLFVDKMGIYFSVDSVYIQGINPFTIVPQIENATGNIINDTANWTQITGDFIAQGGERYLTIGNFRNAANTMVDSTSNPNGWLPDAYYYVDDISVVDCTVGINEIKSDIKLGVYPNPTHGNLNLSFNATGLHITEIEIENLQGERMALISYEGAVTNKLSIDLSYLQQGLYFIKAKTQKGVYVSKFIKQ